MRLDHDWWPAEIPDNVVVGPGTYVHTSYSFHHYRSRRPCGLRVGANSSLYEDASFELGPEGEVEIGDYTMLFGGKFNANSRIVVGSYTLVSYETYIADGFAPVPPVDPAYPAAPQGSGPAPTTVTIGDVCWIGVRATIVAPAHLGDGVIVAAGAVVDFDVPDFAVVAGNPAGVVGWARPEAQGRSTGGPPGRPRA
jgi:acetyltransferase-like isoleucine patch superfamily enzyme